MTQQNASASEEMSATSEELAAQAEQLQVDHLLLPHRCSRPRAERLPAPIDRAVDASCAQGGAAWRPAIAAKKPACRQVARALKVAGGGGFAFDMHDGEDDRDAEFQR